MVAAALLASLLRLADPARIAESVTVTAPEARRIAVTATATVLTRDALAASPSFTLDQKLGATPGFSLFRRSSSRTANPTTQGVTLRGLSASGASRTLVMADDVPLNDPFGGWVYWNRMPAAAIDRVEVSRGGSSDLFGSDAMGGTIRVLSRRDPAGEVWIEGGSHETARVSAYGGLAGPVGVSAGAEGSTTEGYVPVEPASRGAVDAPAGSKYWSGVTNLRAAAGGIRFDAGGSLLSEDRTNGTRLQTNATRIGTGYLGAGGDAGGGFWRVRAHVSDQDYDQTFSAVGAGRATERLTNVQHVDSRSRRVDASWSQAGPRVSFLVDGAFRQIAADLLDQNSLTRARQRFAGLGGQLVWHAAPGVTISGGVHGELWTSSSETNPGVESRELFLAPRASVSWRVTGDATFRATAFDAYRAPTINELYRSFRVGDVVTQPDPLLNPEDARGGEAALTFARPRWTARAVLFATWLDGAIYSRTVPSLTGIVRVRSNGEARAAGGEVEVDARLNDRVAVWASFTAGASRLTGGQLDGNRLPQVPRAQAAAGIRLTDGRWLASFDARHVASQFDDDRNVFELEAATVAAALVSARFARAHLFASVENLFDADVDAGRTPLRTLAQPRMWQVGLRLR